MRVQEGKGQNPRLVPQPGGDGCFISAVMMLFLPCYLSQNRSLGPSVAFKAKLLKSIFPPSLIFPKLQVAPGRVKNNSSQQEFLEPKLDGVDVSQPASPVFSFTGRGVTPWP